MRCSYFAAAAPPWTFHVSTTTVSAGASPNAPSRSIPPSATTGTAYASVKTPTALADEFIDCFMAEDERISSFSVRLRLAFLNKVNALASRIDLLEARIKSADPRAILKRGYLLAADARGRVLKSASGAAPGDRISLLFADGTLGCEVKTRE